MQRDFIGPQRSRWNPVSLSSKTWQHFWFPHLLKIKYATSFFSTLSTLCSRPFCSLSPQHNPNSHGLTPVIHLPSQVSKHPVSRDWSDLPVYRSVCVSPIEYRAPGPITDGKLTPDNVQLLISTATSYTEAEALSNWCPIHAKSQQGRRQSCHHWTHMGRRGQFRRFY